MVVYLLNCGASDACGELVTRYQTNVFNVSYRILHERGEAEDLAQETFMRKFAYNIKDSGPTCPKP